MKMLEAAADKVGLGGVLDAVQDAGQNLVGGAFKKMLESVVTQTLEWLGPKAGEVAVEKMSEKYSGIPQSAQETGQKAAADAIMGFQDLIMDFCEEAVEAPQAAFKKVGVLMLRACNDGAAKAVMAIMNSMGCACCIKACANVNDIIAKVQEVVQTALKEQVTSTLKSKGAPSMITDKLEWGNPDDDIGEPSKKASPQQEEMS
eukprot:CAMPEP_0172660518 /NCGR_PEP_ID=MMETSP1074-20121228/4110_1 /TAXON_ID=2916 /ORGANISM="Ceratium fusus, Strain PA161109" /LENGTH=202 /DNA_ID=CAMNT_0013476143 /DNA_START=99 /DNA_END=707 /DNA_ORIENTATION=-